MELTVELDCWDISDLKDNILPLKDILKEKKYNYEKKISKLKENPFKSREVLDLKFEERISSLLQHAFNETKFYKKSFNRKNIHPDFFLKLSDLSRFPISEKKDFIDSKKVHYIAKKYRHKKTFRTRTCGTSLGQGLDIYFDQNAIIHDTLQAAQQLSLQSRGNVKSDDITLNYYTYRWWTDSINGLWQTDFECSEKSADAVANYIKYKKPSVLAGYPSILNKLIPHLNQKDNKFKLIITNSEYSTPAERNYISAHFGCPVLDEYSSEELTRIAIEMPDGNYYVNEDSVYLEVVDPRTKQPVADGTWGEAVVTSLLNKAMPFIRYATGDWVKKSPSNDKNSRDSLNWTKLSGIGGRIIDSLVRWDGTLIPQNIVLDKLDKKSLKKLETIFDYRIYQKDPDQVFIICRENAGDSQTKIKDFLKFAKKRVKRELGDHIIVTTEKTNRPLSEHDQEVTNIPGNSGVGRKRRRLRFLGDIYKYANLDAG